MSDHHHHHHHHRPHRLSLPQRTPTNFTSTTTATITTQSLYDLPLYTPTPTPSKNPINKNNTNTNTTQSFSLSTIKSTEQQQQQKQSISFLFILLLSLRSLYSLLPFLRSSPSSFSLFPFSFLVSLFSLILSVSFSLLHPQRHKQKNQPLLSLSSLSPTQHKLFLSKSVVLSLVFLFRFQALLYCGTAAMILAELSGNVAGRFFCERKRLGRDRKLGGKKWCGFFALLVGLSMLSFSWDRIDCFPFSVDNVVKFGFLGVARGNCVRFWPMLLPFVSGFLGCYERVSMNWSAIRQLGKKRVRLVSLFYTTVLLFVPAVVGFIMFEKNSVGVSLKSLGWPLANTVVFGVLLSENYSDETMTVSSAKDFQREFLVTFACMIVLELFYFPDLSLWGLLLCGSLLYLAVRELDPLYSNYLEMGREPFEPLSSSVMKPIRHILSERKSRKIALFLLINTGYMVVEFVAGFMSNSLGLISDACHMLFDCAALAIGLYASYISRLPANNQFNYGRGRFEVLSGYVNAVFLVLVGALIVLESFERILDPQEISTNSLLLVSIGGLVVNVIGLIFFHEEHHHAHGGSGCSHSHSDMHTHSHGKHEESFAISHDYNKKLLTSDSCHNDHHHYSPDNVGHHDDSHQNNAHYHDHHHCNHQDSVENHAHNHHNNAHHHDHQHDDSHHSDVCLLNHHHDHNHHHDAHHHDHHHDHSHQNHACHHDQSHHSHDHHHVHSHNHECQGGHHHDHAHGGHSIPSSVREEPKKHKHLHIDHNMEGIFLHVLADTMGSVGVVISTLLIKYKGWLVADPACSIFISVLIISSVISLLRNSAEILLQRVPRAHEKELREAVNDVMKIKGVHSIQNLHVWSFTNTDVVGTLHLHVSAETDRASLKGQVSHIFHEVGVEDLTLQVECVK